MKLVEVQRDFELCDLDIYSASATEVLGISASPLCSPVLTDTMKPGSGEKLRSLLAFYPMQNPSEQRRGGG